MSNQILFRASRFGDLCGSVSKSELTPKQKDDLDGFINRDDYFRLQREHGFTAVMPTEKKPTPLTDKQR